MTANETKIRELYRAGITTKDKLREHVTCNGDTISRILGKITKEHEKSLKSTASPYLSDNVIDNITNQVTTLEQKIKEIDAHLQSLNIDDASYIRYDKHRLELQRELNKINGVDIRLKYEERRAVNLVSKPDQPKRPVRRALPPVFDSPL